MSIEEHAKELAAFILDHFELQARPAAHFFEFTSI